MCPSMTGPFPSRTCRSKKLSEAIEPSLPGGSLQEWQGHRGRDRLHPELTRGGEEIPIDEITIQMGPICTCPRCEERADGTTGPITPRGDGSSPTSPGSQHRPRNRDRIYGSPQGSPHIVPGLACESRISNRTFVRWSRWRARAPGARSSSPRTSRITQFDLTPGHLCGSQRRIFAGQLSRTNRAMQGGGKTFRVGQGRGHCNHLVNPRSLLIYDEGRGETPLARVDKRTGEQHGNGEHSGP